MAAMIRPLSSLAKTYGERRYSFPLIFDFVLSARLNGYGTLCSSLPVLSKIEKKTSGFPAFLPTYLSPNLFSGLIHDIGSGSIRYVPSLSGENVLPELQSRNCGLPGSVGEKFKRTEIVRSLSGFTETIGYGFRCGGNDADKRIGFMERDIDISVKMLDLYWILRIKSKNRICGDNITFRQGSCSMSVGGTDAGAERQGEQYR